MASTPGYSSGGRSAPELAAFGHSGNSQLAKERKPRMPAVATAKSESLARQVTTLHAGVFSSNLPDRGAERRLHGFFPRVQIVESQRCAHRADSCESGDNRHPRRHMHVERHVKPANARSRDVQTPTLPRLLPCLVFSNEMKVPPPIAKSKMSSTRSTTAYCCRILMRFRSDVVLECVNDNADLKAIEGTHAFGMHFAIGMT